MNETKYFELLEANPLQVYYIMSMVAGRCAGEEKDSDSGEDWSKYKNVDISIVRSLKPMPEAMDKHNLVSDLLWEFTVDELSEDYSSSDCNIDVENIGKEVKNLPIGKSSSHFFVKVELS